MSHRASPPASAVVHLAPPSSLEAGSVRGQKLQFLRSLHVPGPEMAATVASCTP